MWALILENCTAHFRKKTDLSKKIFLLQFGGTEFKVHNELGVLNLLSLNSYLTSRVAWGGGGR